MHQAGEHGSLAKVELVGRHPEIVFRSCLDAVGAVAVIGDVEITLEDLVLGQVVLQGNGVAQFLQLAGDRLLLRRTHPLLVASRHRHLDSGLFDVLLGESGTPLGRCPTHVGDQGAHGAAQVDGTVGVETVVLDGDLRLSHHR